MCVCMCVCHLLLGQNEYQFNVTSYCGLHYTHTIWKYIRIDLYELCVCECVSFMLNPFKETIFTIRKHSNNKLCLFIGFIRSVTEKFTILLHPNTLNTHRKRVSKKKKKKQDFTCTVQFITIEYNCGRQKLAEATRTNTHTHTSHTYTVPLVDQKIYRKMYANWYIACVQCVFVWL